MVTKEELDLAFSELDGAARAHLRQVWRKDDDLQAAAAAYDRMVAARTRFDLLVSSYLNRHARDFAFA